VRCDVGDIVNVPVKADEVAKHVISIYDSRIYTWGRLQIREIKASRNFPRVR
jgi:hypothetical protein